MREWVMNLLHNPKVTMTDKLLSTLLDPQYPQKTTEDIQRFCMEHGLRRDELKDMSAFLNSARRQGKAAVLGKRWELTPEGHKYLNDKGIVFPKPRSVLIKARDDVKAHLGKIQNADTQTFVNECIECLEYGHLRSAIVMSWVGAVAILHHLIITCQLARFNAEAAKHPKLKNWKPAQNADDLGLMQESTFLELLQSASVLGKNVVQELTYCLQRRNACGHPNSYQLGEQVVAAHLETLILNVYSKF